MVTWTLQEVVYMATLVMKRDLELQAEIAAYRQPDAPQWARQRLPNSEFDRVLLQGILGNLEALRDALKRTDNVA